MPDESFERGLRSRLTVAEIGGIEDGRTRDLEQARGWSVVDNRGETQSDDAEPASLNSSDTQSGRFSDIFMGK
jgi:hypothetical protein